MASSSTRIFVGRISPNIRQRELDDIFGRFGRIIEISLKSSYGFLEYEHPRDAADAVRHLNGAKLDGERISVEFARSRPHEPSIFKQEVGGFTLPPGYQHVPEQQHYIHQVTERIRGREREPPPPRMTRPQKPRVYVDERAEREPRHRLLDPHQHVDQPPQREKPRGRPSERDEGGRSVQFNQRRESNQSKKRKSKYSPPHNSQHRLIVKNVPKGCSWQDLKDHFRKVGDVCFADVRGADAIVEYTAEEDMHTAIDTLNGTTLNGSVIAVLRDDTSRPPKRHHDQDDQDLDQGDGGSPEEGERSWELVDEVDGGSPGQRSPSEQEVEPGEIGEEVQIPSPTGEEEPAVD